MRGYRSQITRAELTATNDGDGEQTVDLYGFAGETFTKVYRPQNFGISANPPVGATGLLFAPGGERSKAVFLGGEMPGVRPKGNPPGTAVLYDDKGNVIFAKGGDGIEIRTTDGDVKVIPIAGKKVFLGGTGTDGTYAAVSTTAGPSMNVFAKVS